MGANGRSAETSDDDRDAAADSVIGEQGLDGDRQKREIAAPDADFLKSRADAPPLAPERNAHFRNAIDVDEQLGPRQAHRKKRNEGLPSGDHPALTVRARQQTASLVN